MATPIRIIPTLYGKEAEAFEKAAREAEAHPGKIAAGELLDEIWVGKIHLEMWRQHTPYWNPIHAGAFH